MTREDNKEFLGFVSPKYPLIQPDVLQAYVDTIAEVYAMEAEAPIVYGRGELVWWNIKGTTMSITGDEITKYLILSNGYDGKTPLCFVPSTFRAFCKNTLALAHQNATDKIRIVHKGDLQIVVDKIPNIVRQWGFRMTKLEEDFKKMSKMTFADSATGFTTIAASLGYTPDKKKDWSVRIDNWNNAYSEEVAAFGNQSNYTLFQAVTKEMESHAKEATRKPDRFSRSNLFGTLAKDKIQLFNLLRG